MHLYTATELARARQADLTRAAELRRLVTHAKRDRSRGRDATTPWWAVVNVRLRTGLVCGVAVVVAALVSACGSTSTTPGAQTTSTSPADAAFIERANQACAPAAAALNKQQFPFSSFDPEHPNPTDLPKVGEFFAALYPDFSVTVDKLRALTPPPGLAAEWKSFGDLLVAKRANTAAQNKDAENSDVAAFVDTVRTAEKLTARIKTLGRRMGFADSSTCADVVI